MAFGLDYTTAPPLAALRAVRVNGLPVTFVCRYTGYFAGYDLNTIDGPQQGKVLTPQEALTNGKAGIATVSNHEWYETRPTEGAAAGAWDAREVAQKIHAACGGPPDRPIYFSVDFDAGGPEVAGYFRGVASEIGLHRTGAYGSYRVLKYLFDTNLITWGWQTYAWSGGQWEPRAHIRQYDNNRWIAGLSVDYNLSMKADFGQWFPRGTGGTQMNGLPAGAQDNGKDTITFKNGKVMVKGFRVKYLEMAAAGLIPPDDEPLENEHTDSVVEQSHPAYWPHGGSVQTTNFFRFAWSPEHGVVWTYMGAELLWYQQALSAARAEITALKAAQHVLPAHILAEVGTVRDAAVTLAKDAGVL